MTAGTVPDNRYTDSLPGMLRKNDLLLVDQGYFKLSTFAEIGAKGAFFLTRFLLGTGIWDALTHAPIDLEKRLSKLQGNACELEVLMGRKKHLWFPCRLIALRVSKQIADERRRRLKKGALKRGRGVSKYRLRMCGWTLLITTVPQRWLPLEMVRALYTVRWQIELLFKQFKSILGVHKSATGKENRLRCELYGKLIGAVIIHRIHAAETNRIWNTQRREVSMDKLYKRIQERAFSLLALLVNSATEGIAYLCSQIKNIIPACLKAQQKSRMTTLEILDAQCDPRLDFCSPLMRKGGT